MPHLRERHIQEPFDKLIKFSRIVGILGHRQVGKTTFLEKVSSEYFTMDDEKTLALALKSPQEFIEATKAKRTGIDECQHVPGLFPAMKVRIGTTNMPGRFILSGSVRFTSRRAIRESLTGRIVNQELLPFVLTEIEHHPNSSFFLTLMQSGRLESSLQQYRPMLSDYATSTKSIEKYLKNGGLPGLFHVREPQTRASLLRDLLETIIDRDIRLIYKTSMPYQQIYDYCRILAEDPMQIVRPTTLKRKIRISEAAQKYLLYALEAVFLLRRIPVKGDPRGDLFWFEDQIERQHFTENVSGSIDHSDWVTLVYRNLRAQFSYRVGEIAQYFHYRTRGGAVMPFAISTKEGTLGVYPIQSKSDINLSLKRSADSFLKNFGNSKVIFITREGKDIDVIHERIGVAPAQMALF